MASAEASPSPYTRVTVARSALLISGAQGWGVALNFLSGVVMARLLTPADFGLIAMSATAVSFVTLVQSLGVTQAAVQRPHLTDGQTGFLFCIAAGSGLFFGLLLALCAPLIADFYEEPRLRNVVLAFSSLVALSGLQSVPSALLAREMRFKKLALISIVGATSGTASGILYALFWPSYWALFCSAFVSTWVTLVTTWAASRFRVRRPAFDEAALEMVKFGSNISGFNVLNYFAQTADNILIGKFYGGEQLGLYSTAYRLLTLPIAHLHGPIGRVMIPFLSRTQSEPERYRRAYLESVSLILVAAQPGILFATVFSEDVFRILLGEHWLDAAPIFRWLGLCGLHQVMTSTTGWLYVSQGRGGDFLKIGFFTAVTAVAAFIVGLPWGPVGVAAAYTICDYLLRLPVTWVSVGSTGPVRAGHLCTMALPHVLSTVVAACMLAVARPTAPSLDLFQCGALLVLAYCSYVATIALFSEKRAYILHGLKLLFSGLRGAPKGSERLG